MARLDWHFGLSYTLLNFLLPHVLKVNNEALDMLLARPYFWPSS